jgi:hypothetical protein
MFLIIGLAASSHRLCVSMHQVVNSQHTVCRQGQPKGIVAIIVGSEEERSILYNGTTQQHPIRALYSLRERLGESSVMGNKSSPPKSIHQLDRAGELFKWCP